MKRNTTLWLVALVVTIVAAYYQRVTGPTYAMTGKIQLDGRDIQYRLLRSHGGESNAPVVIQTSDSTILGFVEWKRIRTEDRWTKSTMRFHDGTLESELPHQPPAGKLEYRVTLVRGNEAAIIPAEEPLVIRFKGDVPAAILIAHILAMFGSMLLAARAGLEYFSETSNLKTLTLWTIILLFTGGFILGPFVQKYAFGAWWTGWPFGGDLTDNKTAVALVVWLVAAIALTKSKSPKTWALVAAIVMFVVYLVPHSLLGSELDYKTLDQQNAKVDSTIKH
ncbi:MAG: hypothetical protein LUO89_06405 [Methanothrix sp.]|nr:hypothetical protein [Methanothrix sp.]